MEITSKLKEREITSSLNSPKPSTTTTTNINGGGVGNIPITTRSDHNSPYPTTFVTADTSSFKHVVQMLTGSSDPSPRQPQSHHSEPPQQPPSKNFVIPPIRTPQMKQQQQGFKLYERRNSAAFKNMIINAHRQNASSSPRPEILSPSLLDFPALTLSPITPLTEDPFDKSPPSVCTSGSSPSDEEERAIAGKGFYFHPSPISTPRDSAPQLLPLFPLSSPRVSDN